jgi:hypothetical protein
MLLEGINEVRVGPLVQTASGQRAQHGDLRRRERQRKRAKGVAHRVEKHIGGMDEEGLFASACNFPN